jgi:hypothetical protein
MKTKMVRIFLVVSLLTMGLLLAAPIPAFACDGRIDDSGASADCQGFSGWAKVDAGYYGSYRGVYIKWWVKLYPAGSWDSVEDHNGQTDPKYENHPQFDFSGTWDNSLCGGDYHVKIWIEAYWASNNSKFDTETRWQSIHCDCGYGSITIVKETDPDGGSGFNFSGDLGPFTLDDDESKTVADLAAGDYDVTESLPSGWELDSVECTGGDSENITNGVTIHLDAGGHVTCTFTNTQDVAKRRIKVRKFNDENGNGNRDCGWGYYCEDWLNGWEFKLYRKESGVWVEKATVTTTGSDWSKGTADFGEWSVGYEYKIEETPQDGWVCTNCTTAEAPFTLSQCGCGSKEVQFGNQQLPQRGIKACKFNDIDGSGYKDWGEDWLSGWEFKLYRKEGETWVEIATATTTEGGQWSKGCADFGEWPVGYEYKIVETRQDGWACTNCDTAEEPFTLQSLCCPCGSKEVEFGNLQATTCAPGDMEGAATLVRTGNTVSWDITNNSDHPLIIESIELSWPSGNGNLIEVRLGGATIYNQVTTPTSVTIHSGWTGTLADRTIEVDAGGGGVHILAARTETLEFEFQNLAGDPTLTEPYRIAAQCFGQGCYDDVGEEGTPTAITLSSFAAKSSAGGLASPLWLGAVGWTVLAAGSLFCRKRRTD